MAVAHVADSGQIALGNAANQYNTFTVSGGANRVLVVQIAWDIKANTITGAPVWDYGGGSPQNLSLIKSEVSSGTFMRTELWGLVAPTAGNLVFRVDFSGSMDSEIWLIEYTGADQTGGVTTFAHSNSASGASGVPTITITSGTGNATVAVAAMSAGNLATPTQTQTFLNTTPSNGSFAGSRADGAASVVHAWASGANPWCVAGCEIVAVGAGPVAGFLWI